VRHPLDPLGDKLLQVPQVAIANAMLLQVRNRVPKVIGS
jgi:hypothetical protein